MDDGRVLQKAVHHSTREHTPIVIQPNHGWTVQTNPSTGATTIPIVVEQAPDPGGLIDELKHEFNSMVADQQKKYDAYERRLSEKNDFLEYSKAFSGGLYDFTSDTGTTAINIIKQTLDN